MLILWIKLILALLARLIIPPPQASKFRRIDKDERCPACGNCIGEIETIKDMERIVVQHTCMYSNCRARWNSDTVSGSARILGANEGEAVKRAQRLPAGAIYGL